MLDADSDRPAGGFGTTAADVDRKAVGPTKRVSAGSKRSNPASTSCRRSLAVEAVSPRPQRPVRGTVARARRALEASHGGPVFSVGSCWDSRVPELAGLHRPIDEQQRELDDVQPQDLVSPVRVSYPITMTLWCALLGLLTAPLAT
jgi:hypothetical protein